MDIFTADFETTTTEPTKVYQWGLCRLNQEEYACGTDIDGFMEYVNHLPNKSLVFFWNAKFDTTFILCNLERLGWELKLSLYTGHTKRFRRLIVTKNKKEIEFRDATPLFCPGAMPLKKALAGWGDKYQDKLTLYLHETKPKTLTQEEWDYLEVDVKGLAEILEKRINIKPTGKTKKIFLTTSSQAKFMCKQLLDRDLGKGYFEDKIYPALTGEEDEYLRQFYRGGFVYCNPRWQGKILTNVYGYDVNSMYPSIMNDKPLPCGKVKMVAGKCSGNLFVQKLKVPWCRLKDGCIPFITTGKKSSFSSIEYISWIDEDEPDIAKVLTLTNMELELFLECYDTDIDGIQWLGGMEFEQSDQYFKTYIQEFKAMKENNKGAKREFAKLCLNAPSGKFGQNPKGTTYAPKIIDGIVKYEEVEQARKMKPFYLPTSVFITAYARVKLIRSILREGEDKFVYCDTDSMYLLKEYSGEDVHPSQLGCWKLEGKYARGKFLRTKRYCVELKDGKLKPTVAGINPANITPLLKDIRDFKEGLEVPCKTSKNVVGGVLVLDTLITI